MGTRVVTSSRNFPDKGTTRAKISMTPSLCKDYAGILYAVVQALLLLNPRP